ncbi:MAG: DUF1491 family protein, partial [Pseudomonadota bacterium]
AAAAHFSALPLVRRLGERPAAPHGLRAAPVVLRLRSDMQVAALQRQVEAVGLIFTVLKKGHQEGGMIFVKWVEGRDIRLFTERLVGERRAWVNVGGQPMDESTADGLLDRESQFDTDLWCVEVLGSFAHVEKMLDPVDEE